MGLLILKNLANPLRNSKLHRINELQKRRKDPVDDAVSMKMPLKNKRRIEHARPEKSYTERGGWLIYFVRAYNSREPEGGPIKIGFTSDPDLRSRMCNVQIGNPYPLQVLGVVATGTKDDEQQLHKKFARLRMSGEWFKGHPSLRAFIKHHSVGYLWGTTSDKVKSLFALPRLRCRSVTRVTSPRSIPPVRRSEVLLRRDGQPDGRTRRRKYASRADQQRAYRERKSALKSA